MRIARTLLARGEPYVAMAKLTTLRTAWTWSWSHDRDFHQFQKHSPLVQNATGFDQSKG